MSIEGIPDGWGFVRVGKVKRGEFYVDRFGNQCEWVEDIQGAHSNYVVIRKIEKRKRYRPFENAAEADELWNAVLRFRNPEPGLEDSKFRVNYITVSTVGIGNESYSYRIAFENFKCIDGTPFGVEVTE